jgi:hypothetical protein
MTRPKTSPSLGEKIAKPKTYTFARGGVTIKSSDTNALVPLKSISFAPRPAAGDDPAKWGFYNPRPVEEVNEESSANSLRYSIRLDGILEDPVVRAFTDKKDPSKITGFEHIAGECRLTRLNEIVDGKLPCVDDEAQPPATYKAGAVVVYKNRFGTVVKQAGRTVTVNFDDHFNDSQGKGEQEVPHADLTPTISGDKKHAKVRVRLYVGINDDRSMRIAFTENHDSKPLSVRAEVELVERYLSQGKLQTEIAAILNTNITFVSQRGAFRTQLPPLAFEKLMGGKMAANMGVHLLSVEAAQRDAYFAALCAAEKQTTAETILRHRAEKEKHEDEADLHADEAEAGGGGGGGPRAPPLRKKAAAAKAKADKAGERQQRAEGDAGTIKQGHAGRAQTLSGITPRKGGKMLTKEQMEEQCVKPLTPYATDELPDPVTGHKVPSDYAALVRRAFQAAANGGTDPLAPIRDFMVSNGKWETPGEAVKPKQTPRRAAKKDDDEDLTKLSDDNGLAPRPDDEADAFLNSLDGPSEEDLAAEEEDLDDLDEEEEEEEEDDGEFEGRSVGERLSEASAISGYGD